MLFNYSMGNGIKYCRSCWEAKYLSEFVPLAEDIYDDFCSTCISKASKSTKAANEKSYLKLKAKREQREQDIKDGNITLIDYDEPLLKPRKKKNKPDKVYEFVENKKCIKCQYILPRSKFTPHSKTKDGLNNKCTICNRGMLRKLPVNIFPQAKTGFKFCSDCKNEKPLTEFHPKKTLKLKDGHLNQCKVCIRKVREKKKKKMKETLTQFKARISKEYNIQTREELQEAMIYELYKLICERPNKSEK